MFLMCHLPRNNELREFDSSSTDFGVAGADRVAHLLYAVPWSRRRERIGQLSSITYGTLARIIGMMNYAFESSGMPSVTTANALAAGWARARSD
jgi:hypothetical protein